MPIPNAETDINARNHELLERRSYLGGAGLGFAMFSPARVVYWLTHINSPFV